MTQATGEQHVFDDIRAVGDITIAERLDPAEKTASGLIIPDMAQQAPPYWEVLTVGPKQNEVKKGDRVIFTSGSKVEHDGRTIVALRPQDILGVMAPTKPKSDPTRY